MFDLMYMQFAETAASGGVPWWVVVILIIVLLVLLWFWFGKEEDEPVDDVTKIGSKAVDVEIESETPTPTDDLKKIEGIGPKVADLLIESGIATFQQMVDTGADKLENILDQAGLQMINSDTWPEQAQLAAAGNWDALEKLQDELKGGKRS